MHQPGSSAVVLVTGAGGFIGGHLVASLLSRGCTNVRAVDIKPLDEWYQVHESAENLVLDLRLREACDRAARGAVWVYHLASDMGGMGFIESNKTACMLNVLIDAHMLQAAQQHGCERFFYASTACVYSVAKQSDPRVTALSEDDVYPAMPEDGYGWEKLFAERLCRHYTEDHGLTTRVARFHNVYGEHGTYDGGREKAPAAICRKVAEAKLSGRHEIDIWGDGKQTRSFMYIADGIHGIHAIMESDVAEPLNLGSSELVTIDELVTIAERIAGIELARRYDLGAPQGVRGRNSDNTRIERELGWQPSIPLREGLERTYRYVFDRLSRGR